MRIVALSCLIGLMFTGTVEAQVWRVRVLARTGTSGMPSTDAVQARVGEPVTLSVVMLGPRGVVLSDAPEVRVDGRVLHTSGPLLPVVHVVWSQIEPRREHVDGPSPNPGLTSFSNAVLFGPHHGRWIGYDHLEYTTRTVVSGADTVLAGDTLRVTSTHPSDRAHDTHGGAGSSWYAAHVTWPDGTERVSPSAWTTDPMGLSPTVMRVSYRSDDTFAGWLSTYFHVTSVFGSNGPSAASHQTDRYTGADCADVLVGAMRASGRRDMAYTSVSGIGAYAAPVTGVLRIDESGVSDAHGSAVSLRWGTDVRAGDLVAIDYADDPGASLPRAWDHIGALDEDGGEGGADGVLSGRDTLRHMGGSGLEDSALVHAGPMRIVVWRWRAARARGR